MPPLLELLASQLERPRPLTAQVMAHLVGTYSVTREDLGGFLTKMLPSLEDFEVELVLAPLFTPTLNDQAVVAELLGQEAIPSERWPDLVRALAARPTVATLQTEDGVSHLIPLREVVIERFVHRLRLEGTIPDAVLHLIERRMQAKERALLKAIARRAIWEQASRREILTRYLTVAGEALPAEDAVGLLKLVETYTPANLAELLAQIPHWQQVLRQEINEVGAKPFFNERVEELHGGGRDQRRQDQPRVAAMEKEAALLQRLQGVLTD